MSEPSATSSPSSRGERVSTEVQAVATLLRELEVLEDRAFAVTGRLMAALIDARLEQNIAPIVGKSIRAGISDVAVQISAAQAATADVHRLLEALAKARGIDVQLYGDTDKKDPANVTSV